jgi:hypothetical protein
MKLKAIRDRRPRTTNKITISIDRFKALYTVVQAAKNNDKELLARGLKALKSAEAKDFTSGVD